MTFGKDDGDYREYLKNGKMSRFAFLLMQQYGPWNLTKKEHVQEFCQGMGIGDQGPLDGGVKHRGGPCSGGWRGGCGRL